VEIGLIGDAAKNQAASNPENTVYDVKRLIGRKFSDTTVQRDRKLLPYSIVESAGKPHVSIASAKKTFSPEEISAMILTKMKQTAEAFLGRDVKHAVITVGSACNKRAVAALATLPPRCLHTSMMLSAKRPRTPAQLPD